MSESDRGDQLPGDPQWRRRAERLVEAAGLVLAVVHHGVAAPGWRAAYRATAAWTRLVEGWVITATDRALAATGWWTALLAERTPVAGRRMANATGRAATSLTERVVPLGAVLVTATAALLAVLLVVGAAMVPATSSYMDSVTVDFDMPPDDEVNFGALAERSVVYAADGSELAVLHDEQDRRLVTLDSLPDHVWQAALAAEDRNFFSHDGYDIEAITRAAVTNVRARGVEQGGSTITQQLAKLNFLSAEQTFARKAEELTFAMALEERLSKEEILERYLNEVYFGGGAYGIAAAAEQFFEVEPEELTIDQAALLAGMVRAPARLDPRRHPETAKARRDAVIAGMADEDHITFADAVEARRTPIEVEPAREREVTEPYVVEAVKRALFDNPALGETRAERIEQVFTAGLRIHTTVEPRLQQIAHEEIHQAFPSDAPTAALATVDPDTGRVLAIDGGIDFAEEQFDLATQGRRQPGSAFKTFTLAAALEAGVPIEAVFSGSSPVSIDFDPEHQEPWEPRNYGGASFGALNLREAHIRSVNTIYAQLVVTVGTERVEEMVAEFGIDIDEALGPESARGPAALALGGLHNGVTPLEMASAFGTFATSGERSEPFLVERIETAAGEEVWEHEAASEQVLRAATSATMLSVMQDTVTRGTGTAAQLSGWPVAGKTGTTQTSADGWFVGTTPEMATAVWVGHAERRTPVPGLTGGGQPAQLWRSYMQRAHEPLSPRGFEVDSGEARTGSTTVPDVTGLSFADALQRLAGARLVADVGTGTISPDVTITSQSPSAGVRVDDGTSVQLFTRSQTGDDGDTPTIEPDELDTASTAAEG